jgi:cytochrome bd-type quinol oxidase subunit 1
LIGFMGMYTLLAILWLFLVYREIELGPEPGPSLDTETAVIIAAD